MRERFWIWLAWRLPRRLVFWCAIRVGTYEPPNLTPEDFAKWEIVPERLVVDAIRFWDL